MTTRRGKNTESTDRAQTITCVDDMIPIASDIVTGYCIQNNVDESDIYPSIWNDILTELRVKLFNPCRKLLKLEGTRYNEYDREKIYTIYSMIYKRLCNKHCQEISLAGFLEMSGLSKQVIYNWTADNKYIYGDVSSNSSMCDTDILSDLRIDLHQKIMEDNEESLFSLMKDRRYNPMKLLPKLNKVHGWGMQGGVREPDTRKELTGDNIRAMLSAPVEQNAPKQLETQDVVVVDGKAQDIV